MKSLLIISSKLNHEINDFKKNNGCETLIINKNLKDILKKKTKKINKLILITENILPRNSDIYKYIKNFTNKEKMCFIEIGYYKSKVPLDKASSNALINGSEDKTNIILKKIVSEKNE